MAKDYKTQVCILCGKSYKPASGRQKYCNKCMPKRRFNYNKKYYNDNREVQLDRAKTYGRLYGGEQRLRFKTQAVKYKGGKCQICGYSECVAALEFHHTDPKEKVFRLGGCKQFNTKTKRELDKCILVCANCHRKIHYKEDCNG